MSPQVPNTASEPSATRHAGLRRARASDGRTIQSVDRAIDVLEVLAQVGAELPLKEIAHRSGLNVSTCHHLLATLVHRGYVGRSRLGRLYFIGGKISELSRRRPGPFSLVELAMPELRRLNEETGEAVDLNVLQGFQLMSLARLESSHPVGVGRSTMGASMAVHATAGGKAILAWLPEAEVDKVLSRTGLRGFTDNTITDTQVFRAELLKIRRDGYASDYEEFQLGVRSIGSSVRDYNGAVIGAASCSIPELRVTTEVVEKIRDAVCSCAKALCERLGSSG